MMDENCEKKESGKTTSAKDENDSEDDPLPMFNLFELPRNRKKGIEICQEAGLVPFEGTCPVCTASMLIMKDKSRKDGFYFRCSKETCQTSVDLRDGTFFDGCILHLHEMLTLIYFWIMRISAKHTSEQVSPGNVIDVAVVEQWFSKLRRVCQFTTQTESQEIGGQNKLVELDEAKSIVMTPQGLLVQYIFCGMEKDSDPVKTFLVQMCDRDPGTYAHALKSFVSPGTIVVGGTWNAYEAMGNEVFKQVKEAYGLTFLVDPSVMAKPKKRENTNKAKYSWSVMKKELLAPHSSKEGMYGEYLAEYLWRTKYSDLKANELYMKLLKDVSEQYALP